MILISYLLFVRVGNYNSCTYKVNLQRKLLLFHHLHFADSSALTLMGCESESEVDR